MTEPGSGRWDGRHMEALAMRFDEFFGVVLLLVLATYVMASLLPDHGWSSVCISVTATTTGVFALTASDANPIWIRRALGLAILAVALMVIAAITGDKGWQSASSLITVTMVTAAMGRVLVTVVTASRIGARTILGAISVYASLGLLFAFLFGTIDRLQDAMFFSGVAHPSGSDFVFFSYTTLTTVGYGDLVPAGQPGQMIAGFEMLLGQIFLVTLVAGLVRRPRGGPPRRLIRAGPGAARSRRRYGRIPRRASGPSARSGMRR